MSAEQNAAGQRLTRREVGKIAAVAAGSGILVAFMIEGCKPVPGPTEVLRGSMEIPNGTSFKLRPQDSIRFGIKNEVSWKSITLLNGIAIKKLPGVAIDNPLIVTKTTEKGTEKWARVVGDVNEFVIDPIRGNSMWTSNDQLLFLKIDLASVQGTFESVKRKGRDIVLPSGEKVDQSLFGRVRPLQK